MQNFVTKYTPQKVICKILHFWEHTIISIQRNNDKEVTIFYNMKYVAYG